MSKIIFRLLSTLPLQSSSEKRDTATVEEETMRVFITASDPDHAKYAMIELQQILKSMFSEYIIRNDKISTLGSKELAKFKMFSEPNSVLVMPG